MRAVTVVVAVLAGDDRHADLDRGIGGFHLQNVLHRVGRVAVRIVRAGIGIGFPRAVVLVSHFPIFEIAMIGDVRRTHPRGGFGRRAGAVIHRDDRLRAEIGGDVDEVPEGGRPRPGVRQGFAGGPMIFVGGGAAGETEELRAEFRERVGRCGGVEIAIPNGGVQTEPARVRRANGVCGVHLQMHR